MELDGQRLFYQRAWDTSCEWRGGKKKSLLYVEVSLIVWTGKESLAEGEGEDKRALEEDLGGA